MKGKKTKPLNRIQIWAKWNRLLREAGHTAEDPATVLKRIEQQLAALDESRTRRAMENSRKAHGDARQRRREILAAFDAYMRRNPNASDQQAYARVARPIYGWSTASVRRAVEKAATEFDQSYE